MQTNLKIKIAALMALFTPAFAFAALSGVNDLLTAFGHLVAQAIPIVFGLALLFFFYGVALYIFRAGDETKAREGKSIMIYGVIALFVMVSIWGIINFIGKDLLGSNYTVTSQ